MSKNKVKDWTTECVEVDEWTKMIESDKVIAAEIYSEWFGYCEWQINYISDAMKKLNVDEQAKICWTRLNIANLEKENDNEPLQLLEKWSKYETPKPLFVFIQNKKILATVKEANSAKMINTINAVMSGQSVQNTEVNTPEPEKINETKEEKEVIKSEDTSDKQSKEAEEKAGAETEVVPDNDDAAKQIDDDDNKDEVTKEA